MPGLGVSSPRAEQRTSPPGQSTHRIRMIGQRIHQYQITEKLGEGGMGVVYRAEDTRLNRAVALKFLHPAIVASPDRPAAPGARGARRRRLEPPQHLHRLRDQRARRAHFHRHAVRRRHDAARPRALRVASKSTRRCAILIQIADGLKQAHEQGIVHRDMKSSNIMITPSQRAVIMDFGLARPAGTARRRRALFVARHLRVHVARAGARRVGRPAHRHLVAGRRCSTKCSRGSCRFAATTSRPSCIRS